MPIKKVKKGGTGRDIARSPNLSLPIEEKNNNAGSMIGHFFIY
jgi:hypothetical protein